MAQTYNPFYESKGFSIPKNTLYNVYFDTYVNILFFIGKKVADKRLGGIKQSPTVGESV